MMKRLSIEKKEGIIFLKGEVDVGNCTQFKNMLAVETEDAKDKVVLDFKSLDYIDSAGLGILVGTFKRLDEKGVSLKIVNTNSYIKKLFKITKLDTLFTVE